MSNRTLNASRNIIWGTVSKVVTLVFPFIIRTVMIYTMGIQYTGLSSLFTSLLNVLSFTELGIGSAMVFSMYKPVADHDVPKVNALLNFYRICYRVIGLIILVCGLLLYPFLDVFVKGDVPADISLQSLYLIYLANTVLSYFLFAYRNSLFAANQRLDLQSKVVTMVQFIMYICQLGVLIVFRNYYIYAGVMLPFTAISNIATAVASHKQFPEYFCEGKIDKREIGQIKEKVAGLIFQKIGGIVLTSVDVIVISSFLGLRILGIYNGYHYVTTVLFGFIAVIQTALIPGIGNSIVKESIEKNYDNFKKFHFLYIWIVTWWSACFISLIQPFIRLWQGSDNMLPLSSAILFTIYFFVHKMGDICFMYREAAGLWWQGKFVSLFAAMVNLTINLSLVNVIGLEGVILATIFSVLIVYTPYGSWVLFKHYFKSTKLWKKYILTLLSYFSVAAVISIVTFGVCEILPFNRWLNLILRACVCMVLPNVLIIFCYHRYSVYQLAKEFGMGAIKSVLKKERK